MDHEFKCTLATKKPPIEVKLSGGVDSTPLQLISDLN